MINDQSDHVPRTSDDGPLTFDHGKLKTENRKQTTDYQLDKLVEMTMRFRGKCINVPMLSSRTDVRDLFI